MFSILIPTYNYVCYPLVQDLHREGGETGVSCEIVVADDGSTREDVLCENRKINELAGCRYIELKENIGRARIRNFLASKAAGDWLIFIDCDARVSSPHFLENYVRATQQGVPVVCGGLVTPSAPPSSLCMLRYRYEKRADKKRGAALRSLHPYEQFSTFNFLIKKDLFLSIGFDESLFRYGYEDTLFGINLRKRNIPIAHVDNPLVHMGIENSELFLSKTKEALDNLVKLQPALQESSGVLKTALILQQLHMVPLFLFGWKIVGRSVENNLHGRRPSLFLFSLYKLAYYLQQCKR